MIRARLRWIFVVIAALAVACNALLGIDGDVTDPTTDGGLDRGVNPDAQPDATSTVEAGVRLQSAVAVRQGATVLVRIDLDATASPDPTRFIKIPAQEIAKGVSVLEATVFEAKPQDLVLVASPFTPRGSYSAPIVSGDGTPIGSVNLTVTGNLDTSFGDGGIAEVPDTILKNAFDDDIGLAVEPGTGRIAVASRVSGAKETPIVAVYDKDGRLDPGFGSNGVFRDIAAVEGRFRDVVFRSDGSLVAVGNRLEGNPAEPLAVLLTTNGTVIGRSTLSRPGTSATELKAIAASLDGRLWMFGADADQTFFVAVPTNAGADAGPDLTVVLPPPPNNPRQAADAVMLGTQPLFIANSAGGGEAFILKRLADGGPDPSFNNDGGIKFGTSKLKESVNSIVLDESGGMPRLIVTGQRVDQDAGTIRTATRRFGGAGGTIDPTFGDGGLVEVGLGEGGVEETSTDGVTMVGEKLVIAGHLGTINSLTSKRRILVGRLGKDGPLDPTFGVDGFVVIDRTPRSEARRVATQGGNVIVACYVTEAFSGSRVILLRFDP